MDICVAQCREARGHLEPSEREKQVQRQSERALLRSARVRRSRAVRLHRAHHHDHRLRADADRRAQQMQSRHVDRLEVGGLPGRLQRRHVHSATRHFHCAFRSACGDHPAAAALSREAHAPDEQQWGGRRGSGRTRVEICDRWRNCGRHDVIGERCNPFAGRHIRVVLFHVCIVLRTISRLGGTAQITRLLNRYQ